MDTVGLSYGWPRGSVFSLRNKTSIAGLSNSVCPRAVLRTVSAVYINTFNGQFVTVSVGKCPLQERRKAIPFRANRYSASAVIGKLRRGWPGASCPHVFPYAVRPGARRAVGSVPSGDDLKRIASARFCLSAPKIAAQSNVNLSAIASAPPERRPGAEVSSLLLNNQSSEALTGMIFDPRVLCHTPSYYSYARKR